MPKMVKVHVTYGESKRIVYQQTGGEVQGLRHVFLQVFSDVLSSNIAPAQVNFQRYDDEFHDYVDLQNDERVENNIKIRALISKQYKQAAKSSSSEAELEMKHHFWPHHHLISLIVCDDAIETGVRPTGPGSPIFQRPHPIKLNTAYRLWSPVSKKNDSLIQRDPNDKTVNCSGSFNTGLNTVMTFINETRQRTFYVALIFRDTVAQKDYTITGNGLGKDVTAEELGGGPLGDESVFEPLYYWSYTMFRNISDSKWYLGCDNTGKTTLVESLDFDYPNPQALFILNKYN